jgi:circadian clock protein KaiC
LRSDRGRLAFAVDAVILLWYVEIDSVVKRAVEALKMRGSDHDKTIRRLEIVPGGIQVREPFVGREGLLSGASRRAG